MEQGQREGIRQLINAQERLIEEQRQRAEEQERKGLKIYQKGGTSYDGERYEAQRKQAALEKRIESLKVKHSQLIDQFYTIAERKVAFRDEYGDEHWDALGKEINVVVEKIRRKEIGLEQAHCDRLADFLDQSFRTRHESRRAQPIASVDFTRMSGDEFEVYLMELLSRLGYKVCGTKSTGDQGADILATKGGRTIVIQAKKYSAPVGNAAVQEVTAAVHFYSGYEGWVITNSTFTPAARELAQRAGVRLIDGHELARLSRPVVV